MPYMDEQDRSLQERMKREGKVRVEGYGKIVSDYFKNKLNKEVNLKFLRVYYEYFDANHQVYSVNEGRWVTRPETRKKYSLLPFLAEKGVVQDERMFSLSLSGVIDKNDIDSKIMEVLPQGLHYITKEQMNEAFLNAGYEDPFYDIYFYSLMDYPGVNIYARPVEMAKRRRDGNNQDARQQFQFLTEKDISKPTTPTDFAIFLGPELLDKQKSGELESYWTSENTPQAGEILNHSGIVPDELAKTLDELYEKGKLPKVGEIPNPYATRQPQENNGTIEDPTANWEKQPDGSLQMDAVIDIDNYPTNIPDKEICAILDELSSEEKLPTRKVKYAKSIGDMIREVTSVFEEYSYGDRKFIRVKAQNSGYLSNGEPMVKDSYYWIEVEPNVKNKTNGMEEESKSL